MNTTNPNLPTNYQEVVKERKLKHYMNKMLKEEKRAAIPSTRTTAYKIAPLVDKSLLMRQQARHAGNDERFKKINQKLTSMSVKRKTTKKVVHLLKVEIWLCSYIIVRK